MTVVAESISPVSALVKLYPPLNFVVQMDDTTSASNGYAMNNQLMDRTSVKQRTSGQQQVIKDVAVHMLAAVEYYVNIGNMSLVA
ncbi:hypothetical protein TrVGV298_009712 [Trichoderma virens]|nr:hypothetical protein TrVGV298_009712 [Trichoderma virens]